MNAGALAGSSLWRIVISFVLQLLIARLLGVTSLGIYTVSLAYLNVSQVISELGLPALLIRDLAHAPTHRRAYFWLSLRINVTAACLVWACLIGLTFLLPYAPATRVALWLVGASLPFFAVTSVSETLFQTAERMELLMGVEILINFLIITISILILWLDGNVLQLVGVIVFTQAISAVACVILVARNRLLASPQESIDANLIALWRRASPFFGLSIANVLLQRMDILLLSIFGAGITGIYSLAYNLVRVLIKLIQSFWQAVYPTLSRLYHQSSHKYPILNGLSLRYGLMILLPAAALCTGVAGDIIHLIYGREYEEASAVLQVLIWQAPFLFVETYVVTILMVEHHASRSLLITGLHLIALAIALPLMTVAYGATGTAWATIAASLVGMFTGLIILRYLNITVPIAKYWPLLGATLVAFLVTTMVPLAWIFQLALGATAYLLLIWGTGVLDTEDLQLFHRALRNTES